MSRILITGAAGFIGYHICKQLLSAKRHVLAGVDNLNSYYSIDLKQARLDQLNSEEDFTFTKLDICDNSAVQKIFTDFEPEYVVHMAAQAGVRHSIKEPHTYVSSNVQGTLNILEACRQSTSVKHLVYASTSSVYGLNSKLPFKTTDSTNHPVSLYAATKKSTELMAHAYSHLFNIPTTGLRFFTVYGPWGRPDMALFLFSRAIVDGTTINLFNYGRMRRDFTYVDDIAQGVIKSLFDIAVPAPSWNPLEPSAATSSAPYRIFNIGNHRSENLTDVIRILEREFKKKAHVNLAPIEPGDVVDTFADIEDIQQAIGYTPTTNIDEGISKYVAWFKSYYK